MNDGHLTLNSVCYFLLVSWVMNSSVESQILSWRMSVRVSLHSTSASVIISIDRFPNVTRNHHQYILHYRGVCLPLKPGSFQQTRVPNSLPMGVNYVDYEPQGTEVIPVYLQTTP